MGKLKASETLLTYKEDNTYAHTAAPEINAGKIAHVRKFGLSSTRWASMTPELIGFSQAKQRKIERVYHAATLLIAAK